jgi:hypothetical protein
MADALVNLFEWCKRERERLQMQREMLQSGRFRIHENDESGQRCAAGFQPAFCPVWVNRVDFTMPATCLLIRR